MPASSAKVAAERPFYAAHAAAYDALIVDPVEPWVEAADREIKEAGPSPARVLDAGCGTGRHAAALEALGHTVDLLDASSDLLAIARTRCPRSVAHHADICALSLLDRFDAIACRGVLNDLVSDDERDAALRAFAAALRADGVLVLDIRESEGSRLRADGTPRRSEAVFAVGCSSRLGVVRRPEAPCHDPATTDQQDIS